MWLQLWEISLFSSPICGQDRHGKRKFLSELLSLAHSVSWPSPPLTHRHSRITVQKLHILGKKLKCNINTQDLYLHFKVGMVFLGERMPEQEMFEKRRRFATFLTLSRSFLMGNWSHLLLWRAQPTNNKLQKNNSVNADSALLTQHWLPTHSYDQLLLHVVLSNRKQPYVREVMSSAWTRCWLDVTARCRLKSPIFSTLLASLQTLQKRHFRCPRRFRCYIRATLNAGITSLRHLHWFSM